MRGITICPVGIIILLRWLMSEFDGELQAVGSNMCNINDHYGMRPPLWRIALSIPARERSEEHELPCVKSNRWSSYSLSPSFIRVAVGICSFECANASYTTNASLFERDHIRDSCFVTYHHPGQRHSAWRRKMQLSSNEKNP
jgi:hypothetical protein